MSLTLKKISTKKGDIYVKPESVDAIIDLTLPEGQPVPGMCCILVAGQAVGACMTKEAVLEALNGAEK